MKKKKVKIGKEKFKIISFLNILFCIMHISGLVSGTRFLKAPQLKKKL